MTVAGLGEMFHHAFIIHALLAGSAVAGLCGLGGCFLVLRGQVFAADALGHVAYTGAMGALAAGLDLRIGLFGTTIAAGAALGAGSRRTVDDVAIGSFFSWMLGLGVLFLTLYLTYGSGSNSTANVNVLFGSILGISDRTTTVAVALSAGLAALLITIGRPLLFATIDPAVAQAAGVRTRWLGAVFLGVIGATVAEASQIIGALLVLGLFAAPAAAALRFTSHPWRALWLSAVLAIAAIWVGVTLAYLVPAAPASFTIMITAAAIYLIAGIATSRKRTVSQTARSR
jgi:zinc/manganese transport system permease protein